MKIKYTRVMYNCEADIPLRWIERACDGDLDIALKALNENADDNVEIEDIEEGELDAEDIAYQERLDEMARLDDEILKSEYYRGLF
ncbi:hypothetical protein [Anaerococcus sp. AGMB09787]|uniref:hypothetical protein n=1 Tax=Anaerococcus sp. AGMB09787 TaxID=2922869 RepID=UPI001FAF4452|nr:hypothetical protein [Anaerococcus sp. AGMB09787]